jgi:hypothetical protein
LDSKVKDARKHADDKVENFTKNYFKFSINFASKKALYFAGFFWYATNRPEKGKEYIDRAIRMNDSCIEALCVKGWIETENDPKISMVCFEKVLR